MMFCFVMFMLLVEFLIKLLYFILMLDIVVFQIDCIIGENIIGLKCIMVWYSECFYMLWFDLDIRFRGLDLSFDLGYWVVFLNELGYGLSLDFQI